MISRSELQPYFHRLTHGTIGPYRPGENVPDDRAFRIRQNRTDGVLDVQGHIHGNDFQVGDTIEGKEIFDGSQSLGVRSLRITMVKADTFYLQPGTRGWRYQAEIIEPPPIDTR